MKKFVSDLVMVLIGLLGLCYILILGVWGLLRGLGCLVFLVWSTRQAIKDGIKEGMQKERATTNTTTAT